MTGTSVDLAGVRTWYDEHGTGTPLVMLHGGITDARCFDPNVGALAAHFHVYRPERRGHGHSPDVEGSFSYELMAEDTVAFLEAVVGEPAHLVGYSDGANTAMIVAMRRPDLVRHLVLVSGNFHHEGLLPGLLAELGEPEEEGDDPYAPLAAAYAEVSPDGGEHFPVVLDKVMRMGREGPTFTPDDLAAISSPTLVMSGDDDMVALEHTLALYRAIPDSELAVVPRTSHCLLEEKPERCNTALIEFLTTEPITTLIPFRRAEQLSSPAGRGAVGVGATTMIG